MKTIAFQIVKKQSNGQMIEMSWYKCNLNEKRCSADDASIFVRNIVRAFEDAGFYARIDWNA